VIAFSSRRPGRAIAAAALAAVASLALPPAAAAQADSARILTPAGVPCTFDTCVLRVEDGWFSRKLVRGPEGTVVARLGFGGPSLESVVAISDSAVVHARRYRTAQTTGNVLTTIGSLGTLAAVIALNQRDTNVDDEAIAVNVAGLAVWVVGNTFLYKARRELQRSVWWYNRAVMDGR
jgi:hypothetical protein